jgi:transcriptional regulator with XRE-family HTH domain
LNTEGTFGQVVKTRRREIGLTQEELSRRVGCASVILQKIEYDNLHPSVQIAERLAMALNVALEQRMALVCLARLECVQFIDPLSTRPALDEIGVEDLSGHVIRGYSLGEHIGSAHQTAKLWNVAARDEMHTWSGHTSAIWSAVFLPDGRYILTGKFDDTARFWETDYREFVATVCVRRSIAGPTPLEKSYKTKLFRA